MQQHKSTSREQVSLVNLTMALGIAVEFCAHPVHAFMEASGDRPARAAAALRSAGASVLCGIALTKLIGAPSLLTTSVRSKHAAFILVAIYQAVATTRVCRTRQAKPYGL